MPNDRWARARNDNLIQFARLIAEMNATQDAVDLDALCESMDLEKNDLSELFDRADEVWEEAKLSTQANICYPNGDPVHFIGIYEMDRCYGGPEEGGWYYDAGELVKTIVVPPGIDWQDVRATIDEDEYPQGSYSSVIYRGGAFRYFHSEGDLPESHFPTEIPRYE